MAPAPVISVTPFVGHGANATGDGVAETAVAVAVAADVVAVGAAVLVATGALVEVGGAVVAVGVSSSSEQAANAVVATRSVKMIANLEMYLLILNSCTFPL